MVALFVCKCLNITLECVKIEENVDVGKLELTPTEQRDIFFSEKLVSCSASCLKQNSVQPTLIGQRSVGRWVLNLCLACEQTTHATLQDRRSTQSLVLICKSIQTTQDRINSLKKLKNFSPVFKMLVPEVSSNIDMKENVDTSNIFHEDKRPSLGNLSNQMHQVLQKQLEAVEESVRIFRDQKYAEFEAYRERARRDHDILASIVSKARSRSEKVDTSLDNGPPSPQLPPLQRRRLSSLKDAKKPNFFKPNRNLDPEEDEIFSLDTDIHQNNMISDQDDYEESEEGSGDDEGPTERSRGADSGSDFARSLPISMPHGRLQHRDPDDDEQPHDIAASIKALAQSARGDQQFDLPRPRFSTQI